jgi:hypothetical protein
LRRLQDFNVECVTGNVFHGKFDCALTIGCMVCHGVKRKVRRMARLIW